MPELMMIEKSDGTQRGVSGSAEGYVNVTVQSTAVPRLSASPVSFATALSTTAATLAANACSIGAIVNNPFSNTINVRVGGSAVSATVGHCLAPGDSVFFPTTNTNLIYAASESGTPSIQTTAL